jgi:hypothetical protein
VPVLLYVNVRQFFLLGRVVKCESTFSRHVPNDCFTQSCVFLFLAHLCAQRRHGQRLLLLPLTLHQSRYDCRSVIPPWCRAPCGAYDQIFVQLDICRYCRCAPSLTRGQICQLRGRSVIYSHTYKIICSHYI